MTLLSSPPAREPALKLDPGPPPRNHGRRRPGLIYRLFCKGLMLLALGLLGYGGTLLVPLLLFVPHQEMYHQTNNDAKPEEVVQPLITEDQTFDIVATVWIRDDDNDIEEIMGSNAGIAGNRSKVLAERAIFSGTVFRGAKMTDRGLKTSVQLQIPTTIFTGPVLASSDLRASFVIIPNNPSTFNRVTGYSSWIPTSTMYPPSRNYSHDHEPSLAEKIIDAYGTFTPLLSFHNIKPPCTLPTGVDEKSIDEIQDQWKKTQQKQWKEREILLASLLASGTITKWEYGKAMWNIKFAENNTDVNTLGRFAYRSHPYIITKTFLTITDMTKPLNRTAYEQAHAKLAATSCGLEELKKLGLPVKWADWRLCKRSYTVNGNHEVMIQRARDTMTGENESLHELLYAPYMTAEKLHGPLDLLRVPVNREKCVADDAPEEDSDTVNLTWDIVFSSRSPSKKILGYPYTLSMFQDFNMTASEERMRIDHSMAEFNQAAHGHKPYENQHPVFGSILPLVDIILYVLETLLAVHYWYSRAGQSTVGISIVGTALMASSYLIRYVTTAIITDIDPAKSSYLIILCAIAVSSLSQTETLLMVKAITRAEIKRKWIFLPVAVRFAGATHAERASKRVESRTSWTERLLMLAFFSVILSLAKIQDFHVIAPQLPDSYDSFMSLSLPYRVIQLVGDYTVEPLLISGRFLQLVMNRQSGTFAGMYKVTAYLGFAKGVLRLVSQLPWFRFFVTKVAGISFVRALQILYHAALFFQAWRYSYPKVVEEETER
ncbi:hypothetical protein D9613_007277 [Agrocybe pediades]|uniref:Uncharacterized protein n=1 Tax=Agrocybe pediades TaxID=84607 RepID=A0A8H4QHG1_9AGAR|nr:hypothetical protein D9613_007277 [Agrocybe pediades]